MIDQLIQTITDKLGLSTDAAQGGAGVILALIKKYGDGAAVSALLAKIPGAEALADAEAGRLESGGGGLGGMVGGLLGGGAGDAAKALGALQGLGIDMDQGKMLAGVVGGFVKDKAGADLVDQALGNAGWLKDLL